MVADMKKVLFSLLLAALFVACKNVGEPAKHFSSQIESIDEPQTDDERTFVGEYNDFLVLADSLADVWDGNDTLTMRRLYYNQREQQRRVENCSEVLARVTQRTIYLPRVLRFE